LWQAIGIATRAAREKDMIREEQALEPDRPIIDPHLHLWEIRHDEGTLQEPQVFLLPELVEMVRGSGHKVTHTVFVECGQMYRPGGPEELRSLGETEFANGIAAMSASGGFGPCRASHRIVGSVDLRMGDRVRPALEAHVERAGERFRGIRMRMAYSEEGMFGFPCDPHLRGVMRDPRFRAGAKVLADMGLSLDLWCMHSQLEELIEVTDALPELTIVLDHIGTPETQGRWASRQDEARAQWAKALAELAQRPNVVLKVGGMGMDLGGTIPAEVGPGTSEELAAKWRPLAETAIAIFTPARAMFESNFPPDKAGGSYGATWNAFKRIARDYSEDEKDRLFRGTAAETYRI
jgi:predicted TIM-barrel fold metal-dependent hydrolase